MYIILFLLFHFVSNNLVYRHYLSVFHFLFNFFVILLNTFESFLASYFHFNHQCNIPWTFILNWLFFIFRNSKTSLHSHFSFYSRKLSFLNPHALRKPHTLIYFIIFRTVSPSHISSLLKNLYFINQQISSTVLFSPSYYPNSSSHKYHTKTLISLLIYPHNSSHILRYLIIILHPQFSILCCSSWP